ncbi:hypothetical protein KV557_24990 [Kitasatospora aureofaciens]|nr:hypothetical protein [Kitasatospora aureofaciens]MBV6700323.1 hypothetical protein [Kitasatospora aureofaciens]
MSPCPAELTADGGPLDRAVAVYRLVLAHTLGSVLHEVPRTGAAPERD